MASSVEFLRAYDGLENFEGILDDICLRLTSRHDLQHGDSITLSKVEYEGIKAYLQVDFTTSEISNQIEDAAKAINAHTDQIDLIIRVRCPLSKIAEQVYRKTLKETGAKQFESLILPGKEISLLFGVDVEVEVSLVLNCDLKDNYPYPYRKGTWLVQRKFQILSDQSPTAGFRWQPLTAIKRKELGIHSQSKVYVNYLSPIHLVENIQEALEVWVAEEWLQLMKEADSSAMRRYWQAELVEQVVGQTLARSLYELKSENAESRSWSEITDMPVLHQVLTALATQSKPGSGPQSPEDVYLELHNSPWLVFEYCSNLFDALSGIKAISKERQISE